MAYETVIFERKGSVAVITLDRPKAMNALNNELVGELAQAIEQAEVNDAVGAIVITGNDKAFAAGADIKEMQEKTFVQAYLEDFITEGLGKVTGKCRKPIIAAVAGYALGGGCELALMCDIVLAADNARFGQPEINLGIIPGAGGTQRLARFIGKAKTMEMCLTGRMMNAEEAERAGLVSRVVPADELLDEAVKTAQQIAKLSRLAVFAAKESVNRAFETTLAEGVLFERRAFHALFSTEDQKEGMAAFIEKREPKFQNK